MKSSRTRPLASWPAAVQRWHRRRFDRSDAGDTLVEILVSLTVIGVAALAIMLAFATSIAGSGEHRNIVTFNTAMQTATAEMNAAIQQQPSTAFANCAAASNVNQSVQLGTTPLNLPTGYTATISGVQYWTPTGWTPSTPQPAGTSCPTGASTTAQQSGLQLLTVTVSFNGRTSSTTAVASNPIAPNTAIACAPTGPSQLVWLSQPGNGLAGQSLFPAPTVVLEDASGVPCGNDAATVKLAITSGTGTHGATLSNCVASLGSGETTFQNCSINTLGSGYTLTATDATDNLTSLPSDPFNISAGVAVKLAFKQQPGSGTGGTQLPSQPTVLIEDAAGNQITGDNSAVTLAIGANPGGGTLSGCTSTTTGGLATFNGCKIDKAGANYTLTATDAADNLTTASAPSSPFNIIPGPAAQLAFTTSPGTTVTGDPLKPAPVIAVEDAGGNLTTNNTGTVTLGIGTNPGGGTLSGCTPTINGSSVTFNGCSINQAGKGYTLVATDGPTITSPPSNSFDIAAAALTSFSVTAGSAQTAGTPFNVTITALDQSGFKFPNFIGAQPITFSGPSNSPNTSPNYPTTVTFTGGVGTASVTLFDAQTTTLTATLTSTQGPAVTGTSGNITVSGLPTTAGFLLSNPSPVSAGSAFNETVTAVDKYGNLTAGYRGTVHFTSTDGRAVLPANYTFTTGTGRDNGSHIFSMTLKTAGTQSITATDTTTGTITGTQGGITVNVGPTSQFVVSGYPSPTTAGAANNFTVTAEDAAGNVTTAYRGTVRFTSSDAQAGLPGNYTFTAGDNGVHTFSATLKTAGSQSITATDTTTTSINGAQSGITVNPSTAVTLAVSGFPGTTTAGAAHNATVTAQDAFGNTASGYRGTIQFTSSDGRAVLPGNYTFTAGDAGVHVFPVTLKTPGTQSITATDTTTASINGTQSGIAVNAGPTSLFVVSGYPSPTTAGAANNFTVTAEDAGGNVTTGYRGTVRFTSSDGQAGLPGNYTFTAGDNGVHTFSATLKTAGPQSITATDTNTGSINGTQSGITVNAAGTSVLVVSGFTNPTTAGAPHNVTVTAQDGFGNVTSAYRGTVHITSSDGQAVLPGNYTFTAGDAGAHTFSATLKTAGTQSITATDTTTSSINGTQGGITVNPSTAVTLTVTGYPSPAPAGTAQNVTVAAVDAFGNTATGYRGTIRFTSTDARAALPGNYQFTAGDAGDHVFSVTLKTPGPQSITATDIATGTITGTQGGITVNVGPTSQFVVSGFTNPTTAGAANNFTVTAEDAAGNVTTAYRGTVRFTSSDAQAGLPGNYTFTAGDAGAHTFSATLLTAGTQSITATDTTTGSINGTQNGITVNVGLTTQLAVSGFTNPTTAGVAHNVTVTAEDVGGNVTPAYRGTVRITSSDGQAVLPLTHTYVAADNGVHAFSVTLKTAGPQSITATDTTTASINGTQGGITVTPANASTFTVAGFPSPTTAGVAQNVTVTAQDGFGNTATGYRGTVRFTSSDGQAGLPGNYTFTAGDNGVHTFSATLKTAGPQSITATDTNTGSINGTQSGITVNAAGTSVLVVSGFTNPTTAGAPHNVTVTAQDGFGNVTSAYRGTVHITSSDGQAVLPGNYTFTAGDAGAHTFSATLKTAGTQSITATDTTTSSINGTQGGITVNPSTAVTLTVTGYPSPAPAGTAQNVTVAAVDAFGNTATGYRGTIRFTSTDARAALPGNYQFTAGDAGDHVFSVTLKTPGPQSITATDIATGTITGTQGGITVNVGPTSQFVVSGFTNPTTAGAANNFTVTAEDAAGNVTTAYRGTVNFSSSDAQAGLPGNYTFTAGDAGAHTFSATLLTAGTQSITATDTTTGSINGTQNGITVNVGLTTQLAVSGFTNPTTAGVAHNVTVTAEDVGGNVTPAYRGTVRITSSDGQAVLPLTHTYVAADNGVHAFSVTLKTAGPQSITATDTTTASINGTQGGITVTPANASTFTVAGFPSPTTAGVAQNVTVTAQDGFGNTATGYRGTVRFTSSDGQAGLPGNYTFTAGDNGVHTFSATLKTAGPQSITATDTNTGSINGTQSGITVNAAGAASLFLTNITTQPSPAVTCTGPTTNVTTCSSTNEPNTAQTLVAGLQMVDAFGNVTKNTTGGTITVALTKSGTSATLSPASLTILNGQSATGSAFTLTRGNGGNGTTAIVTAKVAGTTQLTVTLSS